MKNTYLALALLVAVSACTKKDALEIPNGSDVTVQKKDGVTVEGKLVEVKSDQVVLQLSNGSKQTVQRADITTLRASDVTTGSKPAESKPADPVPAPSAGAEPKAPSAPPEPAAEETRKPAESRAAEYREVTIPAGTTLPLSLTTSVASDTSRVEDAVRATLRNAITIDGATALPSGTSVTGHVTDVARSAKVKGRARIAFRFTRIDPPGPDGGVSIRTGTVAREAAGTKKKDAAKIGGGAVGGAIIGGILGGTDGAAKGAAIGGAGGTGVVLATRGQEVRLPAGTPISVKLSAPLTVRVPLR